MMRLHLTVFGLETFSAACVPIPILLPFLCIVGAACSCMPTFCRSHVTMPRTLQASDVDEAFEHIRYNVRFYIRNIHNHLGAVVFRPSKGNIFANLMKDAMCFFEVPTLCASSPLTKIGFQELKQFH